MADKPGREHFDKGSRYRKTNLPVTEEEVKHHLSTPYHGGSQPSLEKAASFTPEQVRTVLANNLFWYRMPVPKTNEEIAERIDLFFDRISQTGEVPLIEKLALALGTSTQMLRLWELEERGDPVRSAMVKKAKAMVKMFEAEMAVNGKIPPVTYIFRGKNYYDMKDQQDVVVSAKNPLDENAQSAEELAEKYKNSIAIEGQVEGKLS